MRFKPIGLALLLEVNLLFLLCFTLYLRAIFQVQAPGGLYLEGRFNGGFFALPVWGAYIWRGLFFEFYGIFRRERKPKILRNHKCDAERNQKNSHFRKTLNCS